MGTDLGLRKLFYKTRFGISRVFWRLSPKSIFGNVQEADLAVSIAAVLQRKRNEKTTKEREIEVSELDEVFHAPIAKVLDPDKYLGSRFYEPVILAGILRGAKPHDTRAPNADFEDKLKKRLARLSNAPSFLEFQGELMLAAAFNQLPQTFQHSIGFAHPDIRKLASELFDDD